MQLLEIEKKKISVLTGPLQTTAASLLTLLQLYETLGENWKIKGKTEIYFEV